MITHTARLDVSGELARWVAGLLAAERRRRGTRAGRRALTCFEQAVLGLRWFRHGTDPAALGRDHRVSRATAYRYVDEVITVLCAQAPGVHAALRHAREQGMAYVILDGTLVVSDRCHRKTLSTTGTRMDCWYSGKARAHGGNIQAVFSPRGWPLWVSDVEPGRTHDLTAARTHALGALYAAASHGLPTLADNAYTGTGAGIHTPIRPPTGHQQPDPNNRTYNTLHRGLRCLGERGFALLTQRWRTLRHITASPTKISHIIQAALALTHHEHPTHPHH